MFISQTLYVKRSFILSDVSNLDFLGRGNGGNTSDTPKVFY